jgi:hypothetical protein
VRRSAPLLALVALALLSGCEPDEAAPGSLPFGAAEVGDCVDVLSLDPVPCAGSGTAEVVGFVELDAPFDNAVADRECSALAADSSEQDLRWQVLVPGDDPARLICLVLPES